MESDQLDQARNVRKKLLLLYLYARRKNFCLSERERHLLILMTLHLKRVSQKKIHDDGGFVPLIN